MKRMLFLCLITVFGWQVGTAQVGGASNRRTTTRVVTPKEQRQITVANAVAEEAQSNIVYDEDLTDDTDATGGNARAPKIVPIETSNLTKDGVQMYKTRNGRKVVYSSQYNAFVPVRTRQEALRVALDEYDADDNAAGLKVKARNPSKRGKKAVVATKVSENRKRVTTTPDEEEEIED